METCYGLFAVSTLAVHFSGVHHLWHMTQIMCHPMRQRQCSKVGCSEPATTTLTYRYDRSAVWLDLLSAERDPHDYDLCERHAARLSVPSGWHLDDRRLDTERRLTHRLAG